MFNLKSTTFSVKADKSPLAFQIQEPTNPDRVRRFRMSDQNVDREGEVVLLSAWKDLNDFIANPVLMAWHDYRQLPIGKGIAIGVTADGLEGDFEFDPPEVDEFADQVLAKIDHGTLKTGSVGFISIETKQAKGHPMESEFPEARYITEEASLLEFSIAPVPMNPRAMVKAKQALAQFADEEERDGEDVELVKEFEAESTKHGTDSDFTLAMQIKSKLLINELGE